MTVAMNLADPSGSSPALTSAVLDLLDRPGALETSQRAAWERGRETIWPCFASACAKLVAQTVAPRAGLLPARDATPSFAAIRAMSDGTGMLQHAIGIIPDRRHGYCIDDNARALLLMLVGYPLAVLVATVLQVLALRVIDPPISAFMLERQWQAIQAGDEGFVLRHQWRDWERLSAALPVALVAAEDQRFPTHSGFDLEAIERAIESNASGQPMRGASTISQQVAKNLFLWDGRSYARKGIEAWYTVLIEVLWPKRRILEVYANIAEFGDGVYGAEAAAQEFFGTSAARLSATESARLAAVLPSPKRYSAASPGPYVVRRAVWIERQARNLGGADYLDDCCGPAGSGGSRP
jgi:monofunctional biosynthetic peptidoglycan transglycosylase